MTDTEADIFWDDADPEGSHNDIDDIMENYCCDEIVRVNRAKRLTDKFCVRVLTGDDLVTHTFDSEEDAEAFLAARS
jgi:hypothetical protein